MSHISIDEHRVLFNALCNLPAEYNLQTLPPRSVLEANKIDVRLFVKWYYNRPQRCPSCNSEDAWSIGGESDVLYTCTSCFYDIFVEKSLAEKAEDFEEDWNPEGQKNKLSNDNFEQNEETDFVDVFFRIDSIANAYFESEFGRQYVPRDPSAPPIAIPWVSFGDVACAFSCLCKLKQLSSADCAMDSPQVWWCYFFVTQDVTNITVDILRRLIVYSRLWESADLVVSQEAPFVVKSASKNPQPPQPLLYWLQAAQSSHNNISVHDMHTFLPVQVNKEQHEEQLNKSIFIRQTEHRNILKIASLCGYLKLDRWSSLLDNAKCVRLMNDMFYFFHHPGNSMQHASSITADGALRPVAHIDITDEQMHFCYLLFFFHQIRKFASVAEDGQFYRNISQWVDAWYESSGCDEHTVFVPSPVAEIFAEPYLNHLLHIFAVVSCTPVHRFVYFIHLTVHHVHGATNEAYGTMLSSSIERYYATHRPQPSREYGIMDGPNVLLAHIFSNQKSLNTFTDLFLRDVADLDNVKNSSSGSMYVHLDTILLQNSLRKRFYFQHKETKEKTWNTVNSSVFNRDGLHVRNPASLGLLFFDYKRFDIRETSFYAIIDRNQELVRKMNTLCKEILYTHYYSIELTGIQDVGAVVFLPIPTSFTKSSAYLRKVLKPTPDETGCRCGYMVCYRSIFPDTNYVIAWFFYEEQWKIMRAPKADALKNILKERQELIDLKAKRTLPTQFAMCSYCAAHHFRETHYTREFDAQLFAQYIFSKEYQILASSLGRYNVNTVLLQNSGMFSDALSFPMFEVANVERWDSPYIRLSIRGALIHRHYPPFPEVLFPLTATDLVSARQRIAEWVLLTICDEDPLFDGFNRSTKRIIDFVFASTIAPVAVNKIQDEDDLCSFLHDKWFAEGKKNSEKVHAFINRIFNMRSQGKADVGKRSAWMHRISRNTSLRNQLDDFMEKLAEWCKKASAIPRSEMKFV